MPKTLCQMPHVCQRPHGFHEAISPKCMCPNSLASLLHQTPIPMATTDGHTCKSDLHRSNHISKFMSLLFRHELSRQTAIPPSPIKSNPPKATSPSQERLPSTDSPVTEGNGDDTEGEGNDTDDAESISDSSSVFSADSWEGDTETDFTPDRQGSADSKDSPPPLQPINCSAPPRPPPCLGETLEMECRRVVNNLVEAFLSPCMSI